MSIATHGRSGAEAGTTPESENPPSNTEESSNTDAAHDNCPALLRQKLAKAEAEITTLREVLYPLLARIEGEERRLSKTRHLIVTPNSSALQRLNAVFIARNEERPSAPAPTPTIAVQDESPSQAGSSRLVLLLEQCRSLFVKS